MSDYNTSSFLLHTSNINARKPKRWQLMPRDDGFLSAFPWIRCWWWKKNRPRPFVIARVFGCSNNSGRFHAGNGRCWRRDSDSSLNNILLSILNLNLLGLLPCCPLICPIHIQLLLVTNHWKQYMVLLVCAQVKVRISHHNLKVSDSTITPSKDLVFVMDDVEEEQPKKKSKKIDPTKIRRLLGSRWRTSAMPSMCKSWKVPTSWRWHGAAA